MVSSNTTSRRSNSTSIIGQTWGGETEEQRTSWEANGSSYSLNARYMQGYNLPSGTYGGTPGWKDEVAERIAKHMTGGEAASTLDT